MYDKEQSVLGQVHMVGTTWFIHLKSVLSAVKVVWTKQAKIYVQQLVQQGDQLIVSADGAWSHRREAGQHEFTLMNAVEKKIVACVSVTKARYQENQRLEGTGNFVGSSKSMEACALQWALEQLKDTGLLPLVTKWVADKDLSVAKILREDRRTSHVLTLYDPGHIKKNLVTNIAGILGESARYKGIALRIGRFWLRLVKRAEALEGTWDEKAAQAVQWQKHIVPHYTATCGKDCPHLERYGREGVDDLTATADEQIIGDGVSADAVDSESTDTIVPAVAAAACAAMALMDVKAGDEESRRFLNIDLSLPNLGKKGLQFPADDTARVNAITVLLERAMADAKLYVHGYSTCSLERFHSQRTVLTPKRIEYWRSWEGLAQLAALLHNEGYEMTTELVMTQLGMEMGATQHTLLQRLDRKKLYHKTRKEQPAYKQRNAELKREAQRRKAKEAPTAASLPKYTPNSPLYTDEELTQDLKAAALKPLSKKKKKKGLPAGGGKKSVKRKVVYAEVDAATSSVAALLLDVSRSGNTGSENTNPNVPAGEQPQKKRRVSTNSKNRAARATKAPASHGSDAVAAAADYSPSHIVLQCRMAGERKERRCQWVLR
jgi:hypothetical protein